MTVPTPAAVLAVAFAILIGWALARAQYEAR